MTRPTRVRRVLMTADTVGGVWTYAVELARGLAARGVEVSLATMGAPLDADARSEAGDVPGLTVYDGAFRLEWMREPWADVDRAGRWLSDLEREARPDLVHLNGYAHAALPWRAPVLLAAHSCVASWWRAVKGEAAPPEWDEYRRRVRDGLDHADLVVAPTSAMLTALRREHGPVPRARVIPNGRDPGRFQARPKEPFLLSVGRLWDDAKNVSALAAIAPDLPWPVRVAGATRDDEGRTARFEGCRLLGRLSPGEVADQMARASVYVHPARYEPFGLAPLEAALSGCALLLADLPSLREVWGDAAAYVPADDAAALRRAATDLIRDGGLRADLRARASRRAAALTASRMAGAYLASYETLVERKVAA